MKIFEIGTGYTSIPAKMGAATEIVVEELSRSMIKLGHDVSVVDIKDAERGNTELPIIETYMPQFLSTGAVVNLGVIHKIKRVLYSISLTYKLHKLIKKEKNKIVLHFHNQYNLFFFLKLTPKSLREKITIAYTVHSYIWFGNWNDIKDVAKTKYFQEIECCRQADKVFVLNDVVSNMLINNLAVEREKICLVNNGVNVTTYNRENSNRANIELIKNKYKLESKKIVFQSGSVCDRKNQLGSLELLLPILKKYKDVVFVYAGGIIDNEYAKKVTDFASSNGLNGQVIYVGELAPGKTLNDFYSMSFCSIVNSKSESFALVIAEALSSMAPTFVSKEIMDSLDYWGKNVGNGLIRIDAENFVNDFEHMLIDSTYYSLMQEKGRNFIVGEYSWDVAARQYCDNF